MKLKLLAHLDGVLAENELRETGGANLTLEAFHALVLAATGSKVKAEKAASARMAAQLRSGQKVT